MNRRTLTKFDLNRRGFLFQGAAVTAGLALKTSGIGVAANFLMSGHAHAYNLNNVPPAFTEKLLFNGEKTDRFVADRRFNTQQEMAKLYMELRNSDGDGQLQWHMLLGNNPRNSHVTNLPREVWYCDTLQHAILCMTFMKKDIAYAYHFAPSEVLWNQGKSKQSQYFYHNYALSEGISDFYFQFLIGSWNLPDAEKMLVHALFSAAEPSPVNGKQKAEQYLKANFDERTQLISELRDIYNSFDVSDKEALRADRDISGTAGKGPLNNWYRLLSAQGAAFFLTNTYWILSKSAGDKNHNMMNLIYKNIEMITGEKTFMIRNGPKLINEHY